MRLRLLHYCYFSQAPATISSHDEYVDQFLDYVDGESTRNFILKTDITRAAYTSRSSCRKSSAYHHQTNASVIWDVRTVSQTSKAIEITHRIKVIQPD